MLHPDSIRALHQADKSQAPLRRVGLEAPLPSETAAWLAHLEVDRVYRPSQAAECVYRPHEAAKSSAIA